MTVREGTHALCSCGFLGSISIGNHWPIRFDVASGEYRVASTDGTEYLIIHFCPRCGLPMPRSSNVERFHSIDDAEVAALKTKIGDCTKLNDLIARIGAPSRYVDTNGNDRLWDRAGAASSDMELVYNALSDQLNVVVRIRDRLIASIAWMPKPMQ